jgi:hypothetical protein
MVLQCRTALHKLLFADAVWRDALLFDALNKLTTFSLCNVLIVMRYIMALVQPAMASVSPSQRHMQSLLYMY